MMETDKAIQNKFRFNGRKRNLPWYPRLGTRRNLAELFGELGFDFGIEVGTRQGVFAKVLCENNPKLKLYCVDPWVAYGGSSQEEQDRRYSEAKNTLQNFNAELIRSKSMDIVNDFKDNSFDFIYSLSVLHSTNPAKSIKEINRVLTDDGKAVVYIFVGGKEGANKENFVKVVEEYFDIENSIDVSIEDDAGDKHKALIMYLNVKSDK